MFNPIRRYRQQKGWTRRELARRSEVSVDTVAAWEKGVMPRAKKLWRLAALFEVDVLELINEILDWRVWQGVQETIGTVSGAGSSRCEGSP